jgi:hypothetical protein
LETHKSVEWKLKRDLTVVPLEMVRFLVQEEEIDLYHLGNHKEYCFSITCTAKKPNTQKKNAGNSVAFCMMFKNKLLSNNKHLIVYIFLKKTLPLREICKYCFWSSIDQCFGNTLTHTYSNRNLLNLFAGLFVVCE